MSFLTEQLEVGNIGVKQLREQRELITNRWEKMGLLNGLEGNIKENCAMLFENQLTHMLTESSQSTNSGQFETVAFPVIRRVFAKLLANDIVSVQALNLPIGRLYYINPKTSQRQANGQQYTPDGAYSNAAGNQNVTYQQNSLYDAFYATAYGDEGTQLFDGSKGTITVVTGTCGQVIPYTIGTQYIQLTLSGFTLTNQGQLVNTANGSGTAGGPAGAPVDTEAFLASLQITATKTLVAGAGFTKFNIVSGTTIPYNVLVQTYGNAIVDNTGIIRLVADLTYPGVNSTNGYNALSATTTPITFKYSYNTYSTLEEDSAMAEVTFQLDQVTVSVQTRKMRAQWTPELAQDVSAFHNIDAEAELTALLSEQMAAEIDREILRDLRRGAAWSLRWDYNGARAQVNAYFGTQKDYNQTLITKVNQTSAQIFKSTLRGGASWIVVSAEISAVMDDLEYFHVSNAASDQDKYNLGIEKIGVLSGRYLVYRDPYAPANTMLIGHKGTSILESGYIYAPYVPMQLTPVLYNPFDFTPIRGIITRYAKKMVLNRYYGKILCDNLQTWALNPLIGGTLQ